MIRKLKNIVSRIYNLPELYSWNRFAKNKILSTREPTHANLGAFIYNTRNIGDEIQTIAALANLPNGKLTAINRDNPRLKSKCSNPKVVIFNGWHTHNLQGWPPAEDIVPIFEGFHLANHGLLNDPKTVAYLKKWQPIGCRDTSTVNVLKKQGVDAFFGGCPTLLLQPNRDTPTDKLLVVDAQTTPSDDWHITDTREFLKSLISGVDPRRITYASQNIPKSHTEKHGWKLMQAWERLNQIANSNLVITNRLHIALPCLAFQTPCLFIHKNPREDPRIKDYLPFLWHGESEFQLKEISLLSPPKLQIPRFVADLRSRLEEKVITATRSIT